MGVKEKERGGVKKKKKRSSWNAGPKGTEACGVKGQSREQEKRGRANSPG